MAKGSTATARVAPAPMRVVEVIRVSEVGGREGDSFISPVDQRKRCAMWRKQNDAELIKSFDELDVSGGLSFEKRPMAEAVRLIESGVANTLLFAYFDRSFRDVDIQMQTLARVFRAGGQTFAADYGEIRIDTPASWFSTIVQGAANELVKRQSGYKAMNAKREAIARGVPVFSRFCRGYRRRADGRLEPDPVEGPLIAEAFRMRADGATVRACRDWLAQFGVNLTYDSMKSTFASRHPLGELHAGELQNLHAHEPLIDRVTWQRVQRQKSQRGRNPRNDIPGGLLARLALLRCSGCGYAMTLNWTVVNGRRDRHYVCGRRPDCPRPVTIGALGVEDLVAEETQYRIQNRIQSASLGALYVAAEAEVTRRQMLLDSHIEAFDGIDAPSAREKGLRLQADLNEALDELTRVKQVIGADMLLSGGRDWSLLTFDEQRALIRTVFRSITVAPGSRLRGREVMRARLTFDAF